VSRFGKERRSISFKRRLSQPRYDGLLAKMPGSMAFRRRRTGAERRESMGQPVVHFEIIGKDAQKLRSYYSELFGWEIDSDNPMSFGIVQRDGNTNADGAGIGGGIGTGPEGYSGHVTFYIEVPDVEAALAKAESLGGTRTMGPEKVMEQVEIGLFNDPEGHVIGVVKSAS
jgi:predicted enzyme related to lactoylglutathione lyase